MIDFVSEASTEPVEKPLWDTMPTRIATVPGDEKFPTWHRYRRWVHHIVPIDRLCKMESALSRREEEMVD